MKTGAGLDLKPQQTANYCRGDAVKLEINSGSTSVNLVRRPILSDSGKFGADGNFGEIGRGTVARRGELSP